MNTDYKDKDWLKENYYGEGLSMAAMGKKCCLSPATIHHWMRKFKMRLRTVTRARELRLRREREVRADRLLRSLLESDDNRLAEGVLAELRDEELFAGCPGLLEQLRKGGAREGQAVSDAERRRAQRIRLEGTRDAGGVDFTVEEQMSEILARFDRSSKSR